MESREGVSLSEALSDAETMFEAYRRSLRDGLLLLSGFGVGFGVACAVWVLTLMLGGCP